MADGEQFWTDFTSNRYGGTQLQTPGEDAYANKGFVISFTHVPTNNSVYFKAFITAYNETFSSDWNSEAVYGRADPIYMFKNTTRKITLAFKAPAESTDEAFDNLGKIQLLTQFLYPTYVKTGQAQTITQSPLVRMKLMNMASNTANLDGAGAPSTYGTSGAGDDGLLGVIQNVTFNHNLDTDAGVVEVGNGVILPKLIEINVDFAPIHEHPLGWSDQGQFGVESLEEGEAADPDASEGSTFPYGISATTPNGGTAASGVDADASGPPADAGADNLEDDQSQEDAEAAMEEPTVAEQAAANAGGDETVAEVVNAAGGAGAGGDTTARTDDVGQQAADWLSAHNEGPMLGPQEFASSIVNINESTAMNLLNLTPSEAQEQCTGENAEGTSTPADYPASLWK